ncbi:hypothetical protein ACFU5Y_05910 [Streptomyces gardneri]|uniref:hypothetical protein n=1 Tax=Streptomyces gardneri TaxID=66892 RepID=UPI0036A463AB
MLTGRCTHARPKTGTHYQQETFDQYMADRKYKREWLGRLTPSAGKSILVCP